MRAQIRPERLELPERHRGKAPAPLPGLLAALCIAGLPACAPSSAPTPSSESASVPAPALEPARAAMPASATPASAATATPTAIVILEPPSPPSGTALSVKQLAALLDQATTAPVSIVVDDGTAAIPSGAWALAIGSGAVGRAIIPGPERDALPEDGYILRRGTLNGAPVLAGTGRDDLSTEYAAYALLEHLGFGFFHPLETYVPDTLALPATLDETHRPSYPRRGMHLHTMHPIELMDSLLVPSDAHLEEAKRYIDWLVANRQDYFQWVLQDTIDVEGWLPHAAAIVAYAHQRGIRVGIDTPYQFKQQNAWVLVPHPGPWANQMTARLDLVLQAGFDVINVELGSSEFVPADDEDTMDMMNYSSTYLMDKFGVELLSKVHVSSGQTAPNYGDINFNFLPGLANPLVGVLPHSVQIYDLFRPAPTYDREDFSDILAFILEEIPERQVLYYPETAYWCSFDVDVPLFLPHYLYSRWNDLHQLEGSGMDGQVNFSSGFEWNYWLNDWASATFAFEAGGPWQAQLERFTRIFGPAAGGMQKLLVDLVDEQGQDLLEDGLIAYLIGWDGADDLGGLVGTHAQPVRTHFEQVRRMDEATLLEFEQTLLPQLRGLEQRYAGFATEIDGYDSQIPAPARRWYEELRRGVHVLALRAGHVRRLYEGTIERTREKLKIDSEGEEKAATLFNEAQTLRREAEQWIAAQESAYRLPVERLARPRQNPTSYEYGYLYTASDAYFWRREELKAIDEDTCPCLGNLNDMLANAFGEGSPLVRLEARLPTLPNNCLDQCIHPVVSIKDLGGSQ